MLKIVEITKQDEWDGFVNEFGGHPLQLWGWGELKAEHNWQVKRLFIKNIAKDGPKRKKEAYSDVLLAAQVLIRRLPWPLKGFAYIPRGPVIISKKPEERTRLINELAKHFKSQKKRRPVCLSIEPNWTELPDDLFAAIKWKKAKNTILIPRTLVVDLTKSDEQLFTEMSQTTRNLIRRGVDNISVRQIESDQEFADCMEIYKETAKRAGFKLHNDQYYQRLRDLMKDQAPIYAAFVKKSHESEEKTEDLAENYDEFKNRAEDTNDIEPVIKINAVSNIPEVKTINQQLGYNDRVAAFIWPIMSKDIAFDLYGGSNEEGRQNNANYLLKWLVFKQAQSKGVTKYDLNGLLNDGISTFKKSFSKKHEDMLVGTYDYPLSWSYFIWSNFLPFGKKIIRKIKN